MDYGIINKIIPFSSVDGPGNRTSIFFQGCNLDCKYCHNPETINSCITCGMCQDVCPKNLISIKEGNMSWDYKECINCDSCIKVCKNCSTPKTRKLHYMELINEVKENMPFITGITTSGGESTLQHEFISKVFKEAKDLGLSTFLDSNGYKDFRGMEELLTYTDKVMLDIKAYDEEEHINLTSKSNKTILENALYLGKMNKLYEIRTVIVPEVLNNKYTVDKVSELIGSIDGNIRYKIIKYRPLGVRQGLIESYVPQDDYMEELKKIAIDNGCNDVIIV